MQKITSITEQVNNKNRVNIYVSNAFFAGTSKELAHKLKLQEGKTIDVVTLKQIIEQDAIDKCKEKALQIIERSPQSEKVLINKLAKKGFDSDTCGKVIDWLKDYGFINDERYAEAILNDKLKISKQGRYRVRQKLFQKQLDKELIDKTIANIDENIEYANAIELAQKKLENLQAKESDRRKLYNKLTGHLANKGYPYNTIKKAVKEVMG